MIGIVATMSRQIEGNRQPALPAREIPAVKRIAVFRCRETGILANRPGALRIHSRVGSPQERGDTGDIIEMLYIGQISGGMQRRHVDLFQRVPGQVFRCKPGFVFELFAPGVGVRCRKLWPISDFREIRQWGHALAPISR